MKKVLFLLTLMSTTLTAHPCEKPEPKPIPIPVPEYKLKSSHQLKDRHLLPEVSGVISSKRYDDIFYVHNDSGDSARLFAVNSHGLTKAEIEFYKVRARDWEDLTMAPCGSSQCIYVADFGNNGKRRKDLAIYGIYEPSLKKKITVKAKKFGFKYGDGNSYNAEGFAYNPGDRNFYIITKGKEANLFKLEAPLKDGMVADKVCKFKDFGSSRVTGFSIHPSGKFMLVRTYGRVYEFTQSGKGPITCNGLISNESYRDQGYKERQGEAIGYLREGDGFVSISEDKTRGANVYIFKRK